VVGDEHYCLIREKVLELGDVGEVEYNADPELVVRGILGEVGKGMVKTVLKYGEYAVASTIADISGIRRGGTYATSSSPTSGTKRTL